MKQVLAHAAAAATTFALAYWLLATTTDMDSGHIKAVAALLLAMATVLKVTHALLGPSTGLHRRHTPRPKVGHGTDAEDDAEDRAEDQAEDQAEDRAEDRADAESEPRSAGNQLPAAQGVRRAALLQLSPHRVGGQVRGARGTGGHTGHGGGTRRRELTRR